MMIRHILLLVLTASFAVQGPPDPIAQWMLFERAVRDQRISKEDARTQFPALFQSLKDVCRQHPFAQQSFWLFPVRGGTIKDVGTGGFRPNIRYGSSPIRGYDFYDGNRHGGHPAYDIFIRDRNQDALDDQTRKPVAVVAPTDLLILSTETDWEPSSEIRGGHYIWALDPARDQILYFAHLNEIRAKPGAFCRAGEAIGTVGRTGANAWPARSPTHLHLMALQVKDSSLIPLDYLGYLDRDAPGKR
jgi:peptidoglycan LD-endopeptidase LytH